MIKPEIERKFLINRSAELDSHCIARIEIVQTYLVKPDPDIQRRVRSMTRDGVCRYYYTEKMNVRYPLRNIMSCFVRRTIHLCLSSKHGAYCPMKDRILRSTAIPFPTSLQQWSWSLKMPNSTSASRPL